MAFCIFIVCIIIYSIVILYFNKHILLKRVANLSQIGFSLIEAKSI